MESKVKVSVTVFDEGLYMKAANFLEWFNKHYESIPAEFRHTAYVETDHYEEYGSVTDTLLLKYERPENETERASRRTSEQARAEYRRAEYERLKKEFEGT